MLERANVATVRAKEFLANTGSVLSKAQSLVSGDSQIFAVAPKSSEIRQALCSNSVYDKMYGMKVITAQICKGSDMQSFFTDVVKNIHEPSMELRKLIYMFVVHYAHVCPNEALLSISAFQKDLTDANIHVRALALRMLCSISIPTIHPVVMVALRKCAKDQAPIVRKAAAIGLLKAHTICKTNVQTDSIYQVLQDLLGDRNPDVIGTAVMVFQRIAPDREDLLHPVFRKICRELPNCEEWAQEAILRVLLRYARRQFCDPALPPAAASASSSASSSSSLGLAFPRAGGAAAGMSPDHELLLRAARALLTSLSAAVVVAASAVLLHCGPPDALDDAAAPLVRVYRHAAAGRAALLGVLDVLARRRPAALAPYLAEFFLLPTDGAEAGWAKHRLLARLVRGPTLAAVEAEYAAYLRAPQPRAVTAAVRGLAGVCRHHPALAPRGMRRLLRLLLRQAAPGLTGGATAAGAVTTGGSGTAAGAVTTGGSGTAAGAVTTGRGGTGAAKGVAAEEAETTAAAVGVLRLLIAGQGKPGGDRVEGARVVFRLLRDTMRGAITQPTALATVLWLVGESLPYHVAMAAAAPDCFRVFVRKFISLKPNVKEEVLRLGCKVWLHLEGKGALVERFRKIFTFALELAKYDDYYVIRDHARMLECALERESDAFKALKTTLLSEKSPPVVNEPHPKCSGYELGTFSQLWGHPVGAYEELPAWRVEPPDDTLRIPPEEAALESKFEKEDDNLASHSLSLDFYDDSSEMESSDDDSDASSSGSASGSNESSTEASEMSEEMESDSLLSNSWRQGLRVRPAPILNTRPAPAAGGKIIVRFNKSVYPEATPSTMKSPTEVAPPISSTPTALCDAPNQTEAARTESYEEDGGQA